MAENEDVDQMGPTGTFSQLLFSDDRVMGLDLDHSATFSFSSAAGADIAKPPTMLCFGNYEDSETEHVLFPMPQPKRPSRLSGLTQKSGLTCSDSSSTSSINNTVDALSKSQRKRNGSASQATPAAAQRICKRNRTENPAPARARKEKLGERIAALQQLVSPFGKTDTASVLHEAMGYIRFLQEQVQVLCSPYLQRLPSSSSSVQCHSQPDGGGSDGCETRKDLRSRGLCLIPMELTVHVDNSNGADFWSPAMGNSVSQSTAKKL